MWRWRAVGALNTPNAYGTFVSMASQEISFSRIPGLRVGLASAPHARTGVTVVRFGRAAPVVVDVLGGAPATYDIASLRLDATFGRRWAIFFTGGSVYGLDGARGVRTRLIEEGEGQSPFDPSYPIVPISGAAIFDLPRDRTPIPDYAPIAYEAARRASTAPLAHGRVGAGSGATIGKYLGRNRSMPGGMGSAAVRTSFGSIGVLVVVNAVGAVHDADSGRWIAGARRRRGPGVVPPGSESDRSLPGSHTTLALAVTDVAWARPHLARLAKEVGTGLARAVVPYATSFDGDVTFVASTERRRPPKVRTDPGEAVDAFGRIAAELARRAVIRAVGPERSGRRRTADRAAP